MTSDLARKRLPLPGTRRALRCEAALTLQDLADALGVHRSTVSRWERGQQNPTGRLRAEYAALLTELKQVGDV